MLETAVKELNETTDPAKRATASRKVANLREYLEAAEHRETVNR